MASGLLYRLGGLALLIGGSAAAWWAIWLPYQAALRGDTEVTVYNKMFVLIPVMLVFGLFFAIVGNSVPYRDAEAQKFTAAGWALMAVVTVASLGSFFWIDGQFDALGYR